MLNIITKIKASYVFNSLALGLMVITILLFFKFESTKNEIANVNNSSNLAYVKSLANNLSGDIKHVIAKNFYKTLKDDTILKDYIESDLKLFITSKYKHIYIITKDSASEKFIVLVGKSSELNNKEDYKRVYSSKEALYLKHKNNQDIGATYLKPIIVDGIVEAIIVVDFSLQEQNTISLELQTLQNMFKSVMLFAGVVFLFILWFSYIDSKREKQKYLAYKKLKVLNSELEEKTEQVARHSAQVVDLNATLEQRVKDELDKNREKEKQLILQSRLAQMGEMISMIAHQWRQPLSAISATSVSLRLKAELGRADREIVIKLSGDIAKYSEHLSSTIDDFRNFFKPNKESEIATYNELIKSVLGIINSSLISKNIKLIQELESKNEFNTYSNELKQVILNLVKNAEDVLIENSIENPYIKIKTYELKDEKLKYVLEISDNGGGISPDIIDKIFDPYFSTKLDKNGTGLGLYMSKIIIQEHCMGTLDVYNNKDGAIFKIKLGEKL